MSTLSVPEKDLMAVNFTTRVSSSSQTVEICRGRPTVLIGERINPVVRSRMRQALEAADFATLQQAAVRQVEAGAAILDVNAEAPSIDEQALLKEVVASVASAVDVPLCIDTADPDALVGALEVYEGRALINSVTGKEASLDVILPIAKAHDAAVIGLCLDDDGVPDTPQARLRVAEKILDRAARAGLDTADVIIDPLALAMGAESDAGRIALDATELIAEAFGVNITMGISNISFGMPDRSAINAAFVAMAIRAGLTCAIANPLDRQVMNAVMAADLAMGRDDFGLRWVKAYRERQAPAEPAEETPAPRKTRRK